MDSIYNFYTWIAVALIQNSVSKPYPWLFHFGVYQTTLSDFQNEC